MTLAAAFDRRTGLLRMASALFVVTCCGFPISASSAPGSTGTTRAPVMLANVYRRGVDLSAYWASEKMDGVRGYWDGHALWTRGGERVNPPAWFIAGWPNMPMDGELWAGRGQFSHAVSTVRQQQPNDAAWHRMRFMVFDLPAQTGPFTERLSMLNGLLRKDEGGTAQPVTQTRVADHNALMAMMRTIVADGGEGVMLHRAASLYRAERSDDLLKVKPYEDADAQVLAHVPGRGKYAGMLGALEVMTKGGHRMRIGSGFSEVQRRHPPAIGSWISYRYRGFNDSGIPRFATYLRERPDLD